MGSGVCQVEASLLFVAYGSVSSLIARSRQGLIKVLARGTFNGVASIQTD